MMLPENPWVGYSLRIILIFKEEETVKTNFRKAATRLKMKCYLIGVLCLITFFGVSTAAAQDKPVELKLAIPEGVKAVRTVYGHQKWSDALEKASNGMIKVSLFPSGSLVSPKQAYDATINGLADVSCISIGHYPGRFPLTESLSFPGSGISNPKMATNIIMTMYAKYPQMQKEFRQIKPLFFFGFAPISIAMVKKPVRSWEDLKGIRLRVNHKGSADYLKMAGASPGFIAPAEIFLNLQKGIIDGSVMGWAGHHAYGITKLAQYFTEVPSVPGPFFAYIMNKRKFESLSEEQKAAVLSVSGDVGAQILARTGVKEIEVATKSIREDTSKQIIQLTAQEENLWAQKAMAAQKKLIEKMKKRGLPIRQFIQDVKELVKAEKDKD